MPEIRFKHVCSVNTEDTNHPADNLLAQETYRKWQCGSAGEKQAVVVIEFDKASIIHSVDIGNNGSAFIEVLVGRSSCDEYEVLLVASSFMSPNESKSWSNTNRVRMFGKEKLSKSIAEQKWDRIKLVCTQPFNKTEKYGISFIKFHSPPMATDSEATPTQSMTSKKMGVFSLKAEPNVSGTLLFKKELTSTTKSMAAKARQASSELAQEAGDTLLRVKSVAARKKSATDHSKAPPTKVPKVEPVSQDSQQVEGPVLFQELLKGVVFSLSGFQNPLRGNLRDKALEMGAEYESNWVSRCTHLICAFASTPKFSQVKTQGGLIVTKEWILESYDKKRRQSARKYRFTADIDEGDIYDKKEREIFSKVTLTLPKEEEEDTISSCDKDPYDGSTDEGSDNMETHLVVTGGKESDEYDTEDEIERVSCVKIHPQAYSEDSKKKSSLLDLPDFFSDCRFFLYGDFSTDDMRLLNRYITAYKGSIENYMNEKVTHVITQQKWDENFDQALTENSSIMFVQPNWIFACHGQRSKVPCQTFTVNP